MKFISCFFFQLAEAAKYLCEVMSNPKREEKAYESVDVIHENMQKTADYLVAMRTEIMNRRDLLQIGAGANNYLPLETKIDLIQKDLAELKGRRRDLPIGGNNLPPLEPEIEVVQKDSPNKRIVVITKLQGTLAEAVLDFTALVGNAEVPVSFTEITLEPGKIIVEFGPDVDEVTFLFMTAVPIDGDAEITSLVSFK